MPLSPELGVLIMMNNYLHDVATAMLVVCAFTLYVLSKIRESLPGPEATVFFLKVYRKLVALLRFSLAWIVIGGIPRTIYYTRFEWANAIDRLQVPALVVKHCLMFGLVIWGIFAWRRLSRKVSVLKENLPGEFRKNL